MNYPVNETDESCKGDLVLDSCRETNYTVNVTEEGKYEMVTEVEANKTRPLLPPVQHTINTMDPPSSPPTLDHAPSDEGLCKVLQKHPNWETYAIPLGLKPQQVDYFDRRKQGDNGVLALRHWRDGHCGEDHPGTWRFLLKVIGDSGGPNPAGDLEKEVITNSNWTLPDTFPPGDCHCFTSGSMNPLPYVSEEFLDLTPSDVGLNQVLSQIPLWDDLAVRLGVPIDTVGAYQTVPLKALQYWRDGRCGKLSPTTWRFLLEQVETNSGKLVAEDLRQKASTEPTWSYEPGKAKEKTAAEQDSLRTEVEKSSPDTQSGAIIEKYKDRFLACIDAHAISRSLEIEEVIPKRLSFKIENSAPEDANNLLFLHLQSHASPETLHILCDVMISTIGYPKMNQLGRTMKEDLPTMKHTGSPGSFDIDPKETSSSRYSETTTSPPYVFKEFLDLTPSDVGLNQVLLQIPLWYDLAVKLGVPIAKVQAYLTDPLGGLLALQYWRDGRCGKLFPTTWRFLLEQVRATLGPLVAEDLRQKASTEPTWSYEPGKGKKDRTAQQDSLYTEVKNSWPGDIVERYRDRLLSYFDARSIARRLEINNVIPESLSNKIRISSQEAANIALFLHLQSHSSLETLHKLCDVMISMYAYPKMSTLGRTMKEDLLSMKHTGSPGSLDIDPKETSSSRYSETTTSPPYVSEEFLDLIPSDVGLNEVLLQIPSWERLAVNLGVPSTMVQTYQTDPLGGLIALQYWRDGRCGKLLPTTWRFLLEQVGATLGPLVAEDLRQKASTEPTWSYEPGKGKEERGAEQDSLRTEVEKALGKGAVDMEIVKCVTMGPPEAGKTQLKHALLGDFTPIEESTDASTQATPAVEIIAADGPNWKILDFKQLQAAMQMAATIKDLPQRSTREDTQSDSHEHIQSSNQKDIPEDRSLVDRSLIRVAESSESEPQTQPEQEVNIPTHVQFHNWKEKVTKAIASRTNDALETKIHKAKLIYTVDSGGQPSFLDFHPVTATFAATYLLLYNMEEGLDAKPKMSYRKKHKDPPPKKDFRESTLSNLEIICRSLFTLHHFKERYHEKHERLTNLLGDKFKPATHDPPIIIIGTRRNESTLKRDAERLQSECERIPLLKRVQLSFVNSLDPDTKEIERLQSLVCTNACNFQFPLSWFQLHLMCLASESKDVPKHERIPGVFTFSELRTLCLKEELVSSDDEFEAMVTVFHSLGVFSCPNLDLPEEERGKDSETLVFTNPGLLFTAVSKILEIPFLDFSASKELSESEKLSLIDLQQTGELTTKALEDLDISKLESCQGFHEWLLKWLIRWGLAAKTVTKEEPNKWFIPSILPPRPNSFESTISKNSFKPFPLSICFLQKSSTDFTFHYLPEGLFPHFIVQLMKMEYRLPENEQDAKEGNRYRDTMSLISDAENRQVFTIHLMDKANHISVHLVSAHQPDDLLTDDTYREAGAILAELKKAFEIANENLYHHSEDKVAICRTCPCEDHQHSLICWFWCKQQDGVLKDHLATVREQRFEICCLHPKRRQGPWVRSCDEPLKKVIESFRSHSDSKPDMGDNKPDGAVHGKKPTSTVPDVIKDTSDFLGYTGKMRPHLALLGTALGIDDFATATVDGPGSLDAKCLAILRHWLNVTPNPTWKMFCDRLEKNDIFDNLRDRIAQDHGVSGSS